ncbi:hypothetical protein HHK36_007352 [Tetracentron sinense]|uniref:Uncharacterized protein n=1 Tax=Tetracentron sinense TaxID=13715 RepID=A0A835DLF8_TETSI|nr:hypothetical protein HHK36_007352 [Tetracentron sinense]
MDLWVVAAAAGAGYLAKYWNNLLREREGLSESFSGGCVNEKPESRPLLQQLCDKSCPFRRLARRQLGKDVSSGREQVSEGTFSEIDRFGALTTEMATTSGSDGEAVKLGKYNDFNVLSLSSLPPGFSRKKNSQVNGDEIKGKSEFGDNSGDLLPELSTGEMDLFHQSTRSSRSSLRSKLSHVYSVKPISSQESCIIAQLYKERVEMEEYVTISLPSPSTPTMRPLSVTNGSQIISRERNGSFSVWLESGEHKLHREDGVYSENNNPVLGVPSLPKMEPMELPRKLRQKRGKGRLGRFNSSSTRVTDQHFHSQELLNGMLLFCLGITIGVMSTVVADKREADKLNELLKQTENLVQDLQEEIEMKDSLTVKELVNEGYELQETNGCSLQNSAPNAISPEQELDESTKHDTKEPDDQKAENSESMSKIEAELEAELERLELNMNASSLEKRLSGLVEIDPDFTVDIVQGELRADIVKKRAGSQADLDQNVSGTSTAHTHTSNYAVSPQDLNLRLHEVIQLRLEERIMELETALQHSQKRVHFMESEHTNLRRNLLKSEMGSSSTQESPIIIEESNNIAQPLVPNLSGETLDAYNEAYEEFMRITEIKEGDPPSRVYNSNQNEKEELCPFHRSLGQNGEDNEPISHLQIIEERQSRNSVHDEIRTWEELSTSRSRGSNEISECEDEDDDEMGKLLIEHIVEKIRQRSATLNALRMFSMDGN